MLLRFRVENHGSFRDAAELSLVSAATKGAVPEDRDWLAATTRVAGIYGANASGKSTVLHALSLMVRAIRYSATKWGDDDTFPYYPFKLDKESCSRPSTYEIDFVFDGVRYNYGFSSDVNNIWDEWLYSYQTNRRTMLFERVGGENAKFSFGRALPGENATIGKLVRPTSLFISTAANANHPTLRDMHHYLTRNIRYARYDESDKSSRLRWIKTLLEDDNLVRSTEALIRFADLGIGSIELAERELDDRSLGLMTRLWTTLYEEGNSSVTLEQFLGDMKKVITFGHRTDGDGLVSLPLDVESSGTVAWLALGVPALQALRGGELFLIDEIDSSLHPRLTAALIGLFKDEGINKRGGQLIFTSHDTAILGNIPDNVMGRDEVWFTEKGVDGKSELFSLNEFPVRDSDNFERRYLQGRYGAVPVVEFDELRNAILSSSKARS